MMRIIGLTVIAVTKNTVTLQWDGADDISLVGYNVYWSDCDMETTEYVLLDLNSRNCYDDSICTINTDDLDSNDGTVTLR